MASLCDGTVKFEGSSLATERTDLSLKEILSEGKTDPEDQLGMSLSPDPLKDS